MNLEKSFLPSSVEIGEGVFFKVKTDFRYGLVFQRMLREKGHSYADFDIFYEGSRPASLAQKKEGFAALCRFYGERAELPRRAGAASDEDVLDYGIDAPYVYAAFRQCYGINLFGAEKLHWHEFVALVEGLGGTKLNDIIAARCWAPLGGEKHEARMRRMKEAWRIERKIDEGDAEYAAFVSKLKPSAASVAGQDAQGESAEKTEEKNGR